MLSKNTLGYYLGAERKIRTLLQFKAGENAGSTKSTESENAASIVCENMPTPLESRKVKMLTLL